MFTYEPAEDVVEELFLVADRQAADEVRDACLEYGGGDVVDCGEDGVGGEDYAVERGVDGGVADEFEVGRGNGGRGEGGAEEGGVGEEDVQPGCEGDCTVGCWERGG